MPPRISRTQADKVFRIGLLPDGTGGLGSQGADLASRDGLISPFALSRAERVRVSDGALSVAPGPRRVAVLTNNTGSRTFGADAKYATLPAVAAGSPLLIPKGGFAPLVTVTAKRQANTSFIYGARPNGVAWHALTLQLLSTGAFASTWRDSGGGTRTVTTAVVADDARVSVLPFYDPDAGTFTVYLDGVASGAPVTGLASTLQPDQSTGVVWTFGVEKETGVAVTANSHFDGHIDAFTLFTLRGLRAGQGARSFLDTLKAHTFRQWPNPQLACVLAHYDFDEAAGAVLYDRSRFKNHGTLVGASTPSASEALAFPVGNYVGVFEAASGRKTNLVGAGGQLFSEQIRGGA